MCKLLISSYLSNLEPSNWLDFLYFPDMESHNLVQQTVQAWNIFTIELSQCNEWVTLLYVSMVRYTTDCRLQRYNTYIYYNQNFNQISASRLNLNFKILTKPTFRISTKIHLYNTSTKHQQQNTDQTPASNLALTTTSKSWPNLDQTSKSEQKFSLLNVTEWVEWQA